VVGTASTQVARRFGRIVVMQEGRLVQDGDYDSVASAISEDQDEDHRAQADEAVEAEEETA